MPSSRATGLRPASASRLVSRWHLVDGERDGFVQPAAVVVDLHRLDRHHLGLEPALGERPAGPELRLQPEVVGVEAADAVLGGDALGALELRRELVVGGVAPVHGLAVAGGGAVHGVGAEGDGAHVLDAAGQRDVLGARADQAHRQVECLLGRPAGAVDRRAGDRLGQPGGQPGVAGDVAGLGADLVDAARRRPDRRCPDRRGRDRAPRTGPAPACRGGGCGPACRSCGRPRYGRPRRSRPRGSCAPPQGRAIPYTLFSGSTGPGAGPGCARRSGCA